MINAKSCYINFPAVCMDDTNLAVFIVADPCASLTIASGTIQTDPFLEAALETSSAATPLSNTYLNSISNSVDV